MQIVFIVVDPNAPIEGWLTLLNLGDENSLRTLQSSIRTVNDTGGKDPMYFFITSVKEAYDQGKCTNQSYQSAEGIYNFCRPSPSDF